MPKTALVYDRAIIRAFLRGDPAALRVVDGWIRSALHGGAPPPPDSFEDLRQDVELLLLNNLRQKRFRGSSSLKTYVHRIARNVFYDYRHEAFPRWTDLPFDEESAEPERVGDDEAACIARDLAGWMLDGLSRSDRALLWMIFGERYTYAEAARILGKSVGAVRVRAHRCRKKLKERYEALRSESRQGLRPETPPGGRGREGKKRTEH